MNEELSGEFITPHSGPTSTADLGTLFLALPREFDQLVTLKSRHAIVNIGSNSDEGYLAQPPRTEREPSGAHEVERIGRPYLGLGDSPDPENSRYGFHENTLPAQRMHQRRPASAAARITPVNRPAVR
jgi:hypothetical protein